MASDFAIVFGVRTGRWVSRPFFTASEIGLQPVACAPYIAHSSKNGFGVSSGMATTTGSPARAP